LARRHNAGKLFCAIKRKGQRELTIGRESGEVAGFIIINVPPEGAGSPQLGNIAMIAIKQIAIPKLLILLFIVYSLKNHLRKSGMIMPKETCHCSISVPALNPSVITAGPVAIPVLLEEVVPLTLLILSQREMSVTKPIPFARWGKNSDRMATLWPIPPRIES